MFKILPFVANCYSLYFGAQYARNIHKDLLKAIEKEDFKLLDFSHHVTSGFKAYFT
jgi:hypothetical protein